MGVTARRTTLGLCATLGTLATVLLLAAGPAPARVAVSQTYPVPASGTFTVSGHGYGHGRGMSQNGAQGAAIEGLTHEQILDFYYPGTALDEATGRIRVLLTADTDDDLTVEAADGLRLRDTGTATKYPLPTDLGATRWRVIDTNGATTSVEYLKAGTWKGWSVGGADTLTGDGEFKATEPVRVVFPGGSVSAYRGWLRAARPVAGEAGLATVDVLSLDSYVRGVVPAEMPALWKPEAVQSQAVAARTYAVWKRDRAADGASQICDTTACQVYRGVAGEHPAGDDAVAATANKILTYDGEAAFTEFSASSGGWTTAGDAAYLTAHEDPYDDWSGNANHAWHTPLKASAIAAKYPSIGRLKAVRVTARDGHGQWQGRVLSLVLVGTKHDVTLTGDAFRSAFGLKSTWFRLG